MKNLTVRNLLRFAAVVLFAALPAFALSSCDSNVENAVENAGNAVEDAGEEVKNALNGK